MQIEYVAPPSSSPLPPETLASLTPEGDGDRSTIEDGGFDGEGHAEEGPATARAAPLLELLFPARVWLGDSSLPGTGQTICYDKALAAPRPTTGEPYFGQDATYGLWLLPEERFIRYEASPGDAVVLDQVTRLEWQGCVAGLGGPHCEGGWEVVMSAEEALEYCELSTWGGYDDWTLPEVRDLSGIVDAGFAYPSIYESVLPGTPVRSSRYLSSTAGADGLYFEVDFKTGRVHPETGEGGYVRCVRAGLGP